MIPGINGAYSIGVPEYAIVQTRVQLVEETGMEAVGVLGFLVQETALDKEALESWSWKRLVRDRTDIVRIEVRLVLLQPRNRVVVPSP